MSYSCICYKHFTDEDIVSHPMKWVLKNGAVLLQFDWSNKQNRKWQLLTVVPNAAGLYNQLRLMKKFHLPANWHIWKSYKEDDVSYWQLEKYPIIAYMKSHPTSYFQLTFSNRKIKQYHIFDKKIPVCMLGVLNELWLVCFTLTNFQDPIIPNTVQ